MVVANLDYCAFFRPILWLTIRQVWQRQGTSHLTKTALLWHNGKLTSLSKMMKILKRCLKRISFLRRKPTSEPILPTPACPHTSRTPDIIQLNNSLFFLPPPQILQGAPPTPTWAPRRPEAGTPPDSGRGAQPPAPTHPPATTEVQPRPTPPLPPGRFAPPRARARRRSAHCRRVGQEERPGAGRRRGVWPGSRRTWPRVMGRKASEPWRPAGPRSVRRSAGRRAAVKEVQRGRALDGVHG